MAEKNANEAATVRSVVPEWAVATLGVASLVLTAGSLGWALYHQQMLVDSMSRWVLVVLVSFTLAVGVFILYPLKDPIAIPGLDLAVRIAGPAALFFLTLFIL